MTFRTEQCRWVWETGLFQVKGSNELQPRSVATHIVSMKGFTPRDCGDFCGDPACILANLGTSRIISSQPLNLLSFEGLQGFLPSVQQVS